MFYDDHHVWLFYCLTFERCFFIVEKEALGAILCKEIVCQLQL